MTRPTTLALLLSAFAACATEPVEIVSQGEAPLTSGNGIYLPNGLRLANGATLGNGVRLANGVDLSNGLDTTNGVRLANGTSYDGINGPQYAPPSGSGLEQWIDEDPAMRKRILRYLVECALPAGVEVKLVYHGQVEVIGTGVAGLGPGLQNGPMTSAEQQKVSACLLARVNVNGEIVPLSMLGPMPGFNTLTPADVPYGKMDGAYYGNIFLDQPVAHACSKVNEPVCGHDRACRQLADGSCDCGVFGNAVGPCDVWESDPYTQGECWRETAWNADSTDGRDYFVNCDPDFDGLNYWIYPITTYVEYPNGGACTSNFDCAGTQPWCVMGTCSDTLIANGGTCNQNTDCQRGACVNNVCGYASGQVCYQNLDCASNVCQECIGKKCKRTCQ